MLRFFTIVSIAACLPVFAWAQPSIPPTDMVLTPPSAEIDGFERIDYTVESIDLAALKGVPVISSKDQRRIGSVDDLYIDSATGVTYLGLEIGGLLEIGDKEIVVLLDQVSVYRATPYPPTPFQSGPPPPGVSPTPEMNEADEQTKELLEKFAYRFAEFRILIDATRDELESYPEFDLYQGL